MSIPPEEFAREVGCDISWNTVGEHTCLTHDRSWESDEDAWCPVAVALVQERGSEVLEALREAIGRLHEPTVLFDACPLGGCARTSCTESAHDGGFFHIDSPAGTVCLTCREDDGTPVDWPCATAALVATP